MIGNKKTKWWLFVIFITVIIGLLFYSLRQHAQNELQKEIHLLIKKLKNQGYEISFCQDHVQILPTGLKMCFKNLALESKSQNLKKFKIEIQDNVCLKSSLWNPLKISYFTEGKSILKINFLNKIDLDIESYKIDGDFDLMKISTEQIFSLNLRKNIVKNRSALLGQIETLNITSFLEKSSTKLKFLVDMQNVDTEKRKKTNPFQIKSIHLKSHVTFSKPWNLYTKFKENQMKIEIESLILKSEPINFQVQGIILWDEKKSPTASLNIKTSNLREILNLLAEQNIIKKQTTYWVSLAEIFFNKFSPCPKTFEKNTVNFPLTLDHQKIYLGPLVLMTLPSTENVLTWFEES